MRWLTCSTAGAWCCVETPRTGSHQLAWPKPWTLHPIPQTNASWRGPSPELYTLCLKLMPAGVAQALNSTPYTSN